MKRQNPFAGASIILFFLIFLGSFLPASPCTVAAVSGRATPDGRALLWKNRDTPAVANKMVYIKGEKFGFIALIDADDNSVEHAWAGINTSGFAIMNAASGDLAEGPEGMNDNGRFMKEALEKCSSVSDFEKLLLDTNGIRRVGANFGVIDAEGNACIFETGRSSFVKFDAADPKFAPQGYIVHTNFAYTSPVKDGGGGYIRYERATRLFRAAYAEGRLDLRFIIQEVARDLVNEKLHSYPLSNPRAFDSSSPLYINTNDTINRNSTVSVALFHGAPTPEKAYLATMWILLGQPICSVAIPLWAPAESIPEVCSGPATSALNDFSRALVSFLYPDQRGHMYQYLNVSRLLDYGGEGVLKRLFKIENHIFLKAAEKQETWEKQIPSPQELRDFQEKIATWAYDSLRKAFPEIKAPD